MDKFITRLKNISEHPYLNLTIAFLALFTGIYEAIYELRESESFRFGAHHGIILFAVLHILKTIPHLYACIMKIDEMVKIGDENNNQNCDASANNK